MQAIKCEMCNSNDIIKDGDYFVCQSCGTKYTVESARKLMGEEPVAVTIDNSGNFEKYLKLAREAMDDARYDAAYDNFTKAGEIEPDNAECVLGQGVAIYGKNTEQTIPPAAIKCVEKSVKLFNTLPKNENSDSIICRYLDIIEAICDSVCDPLIKEESSLSKNINTSHYTGWNGGQGQAAILNESISNHNANINIQIKKINAKIDSYKDFKKTGSSLLCNGMSANGLFEYSLVKNVKCDSYFKPERLLEIYPSITLSKEKQKELLDRDPEATREWLHWVYKTPGFIKAYIEMGGDINLKDPKYSYAWFLDISLGHLTNVGIVKDLIDNGAKMDFDEEIAVGAPRRLLTDKTDPAIRDYLISKYPEAKGKAQTSKKSGGCYVATCVYGSYDCPQVWTLRRYRDNTLAKTWYGRAFIKTYYAISPTLVKWFGNTAWFKKMLQPRLDRMVGRLNTEGVEDTPYQDRNW